MTAEIAVLNSSGIALAADSAVTIAGKKVYNSANKLFALSKIHPVGFMIYGAASFLNTPWETLVKHYRKTILGSRSFSTLQEYADDFQKFLLETEVFSERSEEVYVIQICIQRITGLVRKIEKTVKEHLEQNPTISSKDVDSIVDHTIDNAYQELVKLNFINGANAKLVTSLERKYKRHIKNIADERFKKIPVSAAQFNKLVKICSWSVYKERFWIPTSGIVFAGYGVNELYPSILSYEAEGRVSGVLKIRLNTGKSDKIDPVRNSASIIPFAQSEMVATFMDGVHPDFNQALFAYLNALFSQLPSVLANRFGINPSSQKVKKLEKDLKSSLTNVTNELRDFSISQFVKPILDSVGALPKDDLAAMAEALVNLTSFRRKVTLVTETVGGPIDVAVISKGDGFVWIKRKNYFNPALNHHFFSNYFREIQK